MRPRLRSVQLSLVVAIAFSTITAFGAPQFDRATQARINSLNQDTLRILVLANLALPELRLTLQNSGGRPTNHYGGSGQLAAAIGIFSGMFTGSAGSQAVSLVPGRGADTFQFTMGGLGVGSSVLGLSVAGVTDMMDEKSKHDVEQKIRASLQSEELLRQKLRAAVDPIGRLLSLTPEKVTRLTNAVASRVVQVPPHGEWVKVGRPDRARDEYRINLSGIDLLDIAVSEKLTSAELASSLRLILSESEKQGQNPRSWEPDSIDSYLDRASKVVGLLESAIEDPEKAAHVAEASGLSKRDLSNFLATVRTRIAEARLAEQMKSTPAQPAQSKSAGSGRAY